MTDIIRTKYEALLAKQAEQKALADEIAAIKRDIVAFHDGRKLICEDGFKSQITHYVRKTPQPKIIEEKFNIALTDDCFKISEYDQLHVERLIVEG